MVQNHTIIIQTKNRLNWLNYSLNLYSQYKCKSKIVIIDGSDDEILLDEAVTLLDDLNTPGFIAKIHELYNNAQKGDNKSKKLFNYACRLLGFFDLSKDEWESFKKNKYQISEEIILKKIKQRIEARNNGNFKLADKIRDELLDNGIIIEDKKGKTNWKFK